MISSLPYADILDKYVDDVLSGKIVACKKVKQACQRHVDDLSRAADGWMYRYDREAADDACEFFTHLEHTKGEYDGQPFVLMPFQCFIVGSLFGWKKIETGYRRFSLAFISVGRGGGKSPLSGGIVLKMFVVDDPQEAGAECYTVATKGDQARIIFDQCQQYVDRSHFLTGMVRNMQHRSVMPSNYSYLKPIASDGKTADGQVPHVIALDEMHALVTHVHRDLIDKLETGMAKRRQPMFIITTTAGDENSELWAEKYTLVENTLDPQSSIECHHIFAFVAEIDDDDSELDIDALEKANPLMEYGIVKRDKLVEQISEAQIDPGKRLQLRRYYGNRLTISRTKTFHPEVWDLGNAPLEDLDGRSCYAGVDLGFKNDLSAIGYCFPSDETKFGRPVYDIDVDVWCPRHSGVRKLEAEPWAGWIKDGHLTDTDSQWTDTGSMYQRLEQRQKTQGFLQFAYDPNNATEFATNVVNVVGITECESFGQTYKKYNEPLTELIIALSQGRIRHAGNPILRWSAMNVVERSDSFGNRMPDKARCRDKIDPFVAVLMAFALSLIDEPPPILDFYENHEPELI